MKNVRSHILILRMLLRLCFRADVWFSATEKRNVIILIIVKNGKKCSSGCTHLFLARINCNSTIGSNKMSDESEVSELFYANKAVTKNFVTSGRMMCHNENVKPFTHPLKY